VRIVLADLAGRSGFVSKDTVAGGYGSRLRPFTKVTGVYCALKRHFHDVPSVHMAYLAAIADRAGHDVVYTRKEQVDGDVALVLSSLVDHKQETEWADKARRRGVRVGFVGLAASKMPQLFEDHADFLIQGEPEAAVMKLVAGDHLSGRVVSEELPDLDALPFPRWDLTNDQRRRLRVPVFVRPTGGGFPVLASRGCPEFCTYCPHRILAGYRTRSVDNLVDELAYLCERYPRPYVIFRDPLFTEFRERTLEIADAIEARGLELTFECETRLDRLDTAVLDRLHSVGLRAISFGVESVSAETLKKVGRRPIPQEQQRLIVNHCRRLGIVTAAFFVLGFLHDNWDSIGATIDYSVDLGPTVAQFKWLTPYPGTPLWKQIGPKVYQEDWEEFDGFTPTFHHPNLTEKEMRYLLGAAYTRFYMRPSYVANYLRIQQAGLRDVVARLDARVAGMHSRREAAEMTRNVTA
jgi:anaerobic magnesium-protoporphyrin IX monomethyl ester cyclase